MRRIKALLVGLLCFGMSASFALATDPTITDVGDFQGYTSAAVTKLGALVAIVIGAFFAFLVVKFAMKWVKKIA